MSLCVYQGDALWDWLSVCWSMRLHVCVVNPFGLIRVEIVETKTFLGLPTRSGLCDSCRNHRQRKSNFFSSSVPANWLSSSHIIYSTLIYLPSNILRL